MALAGFLGFTYERGLVKKRTAAVLMTRSSTRSRAAPPSHLPQGPRATGAPCCQSASRTRDQPPAVPSRHQRSYPVPFRAVAPAITPLLRLKQNQTQ